MTTLRFHNTLSRTKEDFVPLDPSNLRMYVCGPTVYDYAHIGNARPAIVFDVLFRLLRHVYGEGHVTYVRNITDIDDKINARALEMQKAEPGKAILDIVRELTVETAKIYEADMAALGCLPPTHSPRATQHIQQMIAMIQALIDAGHAYAAEGHVLYDVSSKADYGKLAGRSVDDMIAGARIDPAPYKKSPMDFVLWKPSDEHTPGWQSPWGFGRPGWHLECSAMSAEYLGDTFDIHGGGIDLVFPHHENEVAQSEGAHHDHPIARYWLHNGHLQVEGAKMSKSLGNFVTVRELLKNWRGTAWSGGALRLNMLKTHYRQPIDWTEEDLHESRNELADWCSSIRRFKFHARNELSSDVPLPHEDIVAALSDDLNTAQAMFVLRQLASSADDGNEADARSLAASIRFLGIFDRAPLGAFSRGVSGEGDIPVDAFWEAFPLAQSYQAAVANNDLELQKEVSDALKAKNLEVKLDLAGPTLQVLSPLDAVGETIDTLIAARNAARKAKDFKEADRIRDELLAKGIVLKDGKDGTTWEVKR